jgi:hypothetical protein
MPDLVDYLEIIRPDTVILVNALLTAARRNGWRAFCLIPGEGAPTVVLTEGDGRQRLLLEPLRYAPLLAKLKKLARLDVAQRRRAQRGHFRLLGAAGGPGPMAVSVATRPCRRGEIVRLRFRPS